MDDLYFTDEGKGFPLLFIHGFCETHKMWEDFKRPFIHNHRVITIDLPGFGKSPLPQKPFTLNDVAQSIIRLVEFLQLKSCAVVAHSLGGYITLEMIKVNADIFKGVVLFHSTAFADDEDKKESRNKTINFVVKRGVKVFATSFVPSLFFASNRKHLSDEIEKAVKIASETPLDTLVSYTVAMRDRSDNTLVLQSYQYPIMYIAGEMDTSVPIEKTMQQIALPQKPVVHILRDTGHMGMFEKKVETQQMLTDFLTFI